MSESDEKHETDPTDDQAGISDEQLPEDLQPSEDNPLAEPLDPDAEGTKDPDELDLHGGKPAAEWDDEQQED